MAEAPHVHLQVREIARQVMECTHLYERVVVPTLMGRPFRFQGTIHTYCAEFRRFIQLLDNLRSINAHFGASLPHRAALMPMVGVFQIMSTRDTQNLLPEQCRRFEHELDLEEAPRARKQFRPIEASEFDSLFQRGDEHDDRDEAAPDRRVRRRQ